MIINQFRIKASIFCLIILSMVLLSCSRVSQEKFNQIKPGMTTEQVFAILGEPTHSESVNIAGISGTSSIWKHGNSEIDIQFLNDKVIAKVFNKSVEQPLEQDQVQDQPQDKDE